MEASLRPTTAPPETVARSEVRKLYRWARENLSGGPTDDALLAHLRRLAATGTTQIDEVVYGDER